MGLYAAGQIEAAYEQDSSLARLGGSGCFVVSVINFQITLLTFCIFLYCAIWLLFFNSGPATWFENHYFAHNPRSTRPTASKSGSKGIIQATRTFTEEHIAAVLVALGFFCALITLILFVSIQLNKKLLRRMERVNSVIQVQSFTLALIGLAMFIMVEMAINFDGVNASSVIINQMPWRFHEKFMALSMFLAVTASFGFLASYYEVHFLISIDSVLSLAGIVAALLLVVATGITSNNVQSLVSGAGAASAGSKCAFVLPQFSQEHLMLHGCPNKYTSFSGSPETMQCKKVEIARMWEDNRHILVQDQKDVFGCLNLACCQQVNQIIQGRCDMVMVLGVFLVLYLLVFIMNLQYMGNTVARYQARLLNHTGDWVSLVGILVVCVVFLLVKAFYQFPQLGSGPPVVLFEKIRPSGDEVFAYYSIQDPKSKRDVRAVDAKISDPHLSHLSFLDTSQILPSSDEACPGDGTCKDDLQVRIQFKLKQSTDVSQLKSKSFFRLNLPRNISKSEEESVRELILKNQSKAEEQGDIYVEGSQRQVKRLLRQYLIVKPACMFDQTLELQLKIMYAADGQYSDTHSRALSLDLSQAVTPSDENVQL
jgi:hypothetical protein